MFGISAASDHGAEPPPGEERIEEEEKPEAEVRYLLWILVLHI